MNAFQSLDSKLAAVTVKTAHDAAAKMVLITVEDEGRGMTPEELERLKEPYFTTRIESGGSGLGLYICDSIVVEHEGAMTFDSMVGKGTTVTISLPPATSFLSRKGVCLI